MRFILFGIGLFLVINVNADTDSSLKEEFKLAVEQTEFLILQDQIRGAFVFIRKIVENRIADQALIEKWQQFLNQWPLQTESWQPDQEQCIKCLQQISQILKEVPNEKYDDTLNKYSSGGYSQMETNYMELRAQHYIVFEKRATKLILEAKKAGFVSQELDVKFNKFVQAKQDKREEHFAELGFYLGAKI